MVDVVEAELAEGGADAWARLAELGETETMKGDGRLAERSGTLNAKDQDPHRDDALARRHLRPYIAGRIIAESS